MRQSPVKPFIELCKPRILFLVTLTSAIGFFLGSPGIVNCRLLMITIIGTALSCAGAGALNNYLERDADKQMRRTQKRPLPSGSVEPNDALIFGILLVLAGVCILVLRVNLLSGFLALLTAFLYVIVYTPLKRITWLNTFIGAIPGALPPVGGWAAATGEASLGAWVLFLIMFLWQHPHFYAIAWMYKEDYARGGFKMLPVVDPEGSSTFRQIIIYSILLIGGAALPTLIGMAGQIYLFSSIILSVSLLIVGALLFRSHSVKDARRLLRASIVYLPLLLFLVVADAIR